MSGVIDIYIQGVNETFTEMMNSFFSLIQSFFAGDFVLNALSMNSVSRASSVIGGVSTIFLGVLGGKHIITTYVLETDGDKDMDPLQYLVKVSMAVALIQSSRLLVEYLIKMSNLLCDEILGDELYAFADWSALFGQDYAKLARLLVSRKTVSLYVIGMSICILILLVKAAIRIAEIVVMSVLFPLFACDIVTPSRERWNTFFISYMVTIFGYIIQLFMVNLGLRIYLAAENNTSLILAYGCLFFAIKAPKWLERFCYSTGVGQSVGHTAMYIAPQLLRMLK